MACARETSRSAPSSWDSPAAWFAAFVAAALLWTGGVLEQSLWQDEFHSLFHASAESVPAVLASVRGDNHPPLSFLLQHVSCALLGENAFALRLPALLAGFGMLGAFLCLARRLEDARARALAPWLAAGASYLFWIVTAARMYSLVALAALGLVASVLAALEGRRSRWWITLWVALGLHAHYSFFHVLALLGLVWGALVASTPALRRALLRCALPVLAGLALFLPWGAYAFVHQLGTGNPPTAAYRGLRVWSESHAHFFFVNTRAGGPLLRLALVLPGVLAAAILVALGSARMVRALRAVDARRAFAAALLVLALLGPSWIYLASLVQARSGFHLKYLASFAPAALLIAAAGVTGARWRAALAGFLVVAMFATTLANAVSPGRQDVEGAVRFILDHAQAGDAVLVRPWWLRAPARSPTDYGWYAERLAVGRTGPTEVPLDDVADACEHPRVWLIDVAYPRWVLSALHEHFGRVESHACGPEATVHLYSEPRAAAR